MERKDTNNHLCSYLEGKLNSKKVKTAEKYSEDHKVCQSELEIQPIKFFIQKRLGKVSAPDSLKKRISFELSRANEYKESGIASLDLIRWGTHVAQFYNSKNDLTELLVPYLSEGLKDNELCVWVTADISADEAKDAFAKDVPNLREYLNRNQLQIFSHKDWYLPDGYFDVGRVLNNIVTKSQEALLTGYTGLRATGVLSWIEKSDWNAFMEYERSLDNAISDHKALAICVYKESQCTKANIAEVMDRHKYSISKIDGSWRQLKSAE